MDDGLMPRQTARLRVRKARDHGRGQANRQEAKATQQAQGS